MPARVIPIERTLTPILVNFDANNISPACKIIIGLTIQGNQPVDVDGNLVMVLPLIYEFENSPGISTNFPFTRTGKNDGGTIEVSFKVKKLTATANNNPDILITVVTRDRTFPTLAESIIVTFPV